MKTVLDIDILLEPDLLRQALAGRHNFLNRLTSALGDLGLRYRFSANDPTRLIEAAVQARHTLVHMEPPPGPNGLTFRRAYLYPFWRIERTEKRWEWPVAHATFDADAIDPEAASDFAVRLRNRLYPGAKGCDDGFVLIPLQGRLLERRSFQSATPVAMIEETLRRIPDRPVIATLHPKEVYAPVEHAALAALERAHPRLSIVAGTGDLWQSCSLIVTQNSSVALAGFLLAKPAVLFARIDFHHIAANVADLGAAEAFRQAKVPRDDHDRYLWWFFQDMSINAGRSDAGQQIIAALRRNAWPI